MSEENRQGRGQQDQERELTQKELNEMLQIRRDKLAKLQAIGRNPFLIESFDQSEHAKDIKDNFEELEGKKASCAGRIMAFRVMGKAAFIDVLDLTGRIQCHVTRDALGDDEYAIFKTYDIGDIIGVKGDVFKTQRGEISIEVDELTLLSKSLQILPNKRQGLKDPELRYRQRYVDLIMNEDVRATFIKRAKIIKAIKAYLEDERDYLEVDTPILTTIAGGANARPFETHHNSLDIDMKLRISNELYLKRLTVGGLERVYEMGKMFRNEGMDKNHNPEFTSMELYEAYGDMETVIDITEQVISRASLAANGTMIINYQGQEFDLTPPWPRLSMADAVKKWVGLDFDAIEDDAAAVKIAEERGMEDPEQYTRGLLLAELFEEYCEDYLTGPIFITGHPVEISPLAKRDSKDPRITRRFEAYINTWEVANGFSELNDPIDQYERFKDQQGQLEAGDDEAHPMDEDFVRALEVGLPPTGGLGIGIDRVITLLTDSPSIRDIILFPTMRPETK